MRDIPALHGLRGLAALIVIVSHYSNRSSGEFFGERLGVGGGQVGVMLFFLISGFLMQHLYGASRPSGRNIAEFALRRVARVFPLYLFVVVVSCLLYQRTVLQVQPVTTSNIGEHLLFLRGIGILWTVPVEVQFYFGFCLFWVACLYLSREVRTVILVGLIGVFMLAPTTWYTIPRVAYCAHYFLIGILAAEIVHSWKVNIPAKAANALFFSAAICSFLVMPNLWHPTSIEGYRITFWHELAPFAVLPILLVSSVYSPVANNILGSRKMRYMGTISYSMYLLHVVVLETVGMPFGAYASFPFVFVIIVGVSSASYYLIEAPARRAIARIKLPASVAARAEQQLRLKISSIER